MGFGLSLPTRMLSAAVLVASAVGLCGCFDLEQKVAVRHDGSGTYAVIVSADGIVGEGLDKKHGDIDIGDDRAVSHVARHGDTTTQTSEIAFRDLSDLKLGDEKIGLHVTGKKYFGLGGTEVNFHRSFHVDHARHRHDNGDDGHLGRDILHSMFGDHTYTFVLWLPGSIEHIAPLRVGGHLVQPTVWGDAYGHTIIWKTKLIDMFMADQLDFDVDFAAHGDFHDSESSPGRHHGAGDQT